MLEVLLGSTVLLFTLNDTGAEQQYHLLKNIIQIIIKFY